MRQWALLFLMTACFSGMLSASPAHAQAVDTSNPQTRIDYYSARIEEQPRLYAAYLGLAQAYLDMARRNEDSDWLIKSREAAEKSLAITPTIEGYKMQARIDAFRHAFDAALEWTKKADAIRSEDFYDGETSSLFAEAYGGLGLYDLARNELPETIEESRDYYTAAALGNWFVSQKRGAEAVEAFEKASVWAMAANSPSHAAWALVMAAGVHIDAGEIGAARPYLARAQELDPDNRQLAIHQTEILVAEGRIEDAIEKYESVLERHPDAELRRRLMLLEFENGNPEAAEEHFRIAETSLLNIQQAGEDYADKLLGMLYHDHESMSNNAP